MRSWLPCVVAICFAVLGAGSAANAHRFEHPRSLRLGVRADRLLLAIVIDVDPGRDSSRARSFFDRDSDGALSPDERKLLIDGLERTAWHALRVRLGARELAWTPIDRKGHRLDRPTSDASNLGATLLYSAPLPPDATEIELLVRDHDRRGDTHVPLTVDLDETAYLERASQGEWHPGVRRLRGVRLSVDRPLRLRIQRREAAPG